MVEFKINKGNEKINIPSSYDDMTVEMFMKIRAGFQGVGELLEILTGVPESAWMNMPESVEQKVSPAIAWLIEDKDFEWHELPLPKKLDYKGTDVIIPTELGYKTFGQKILADNAVNTLFEEIPGKHAKAVTTRRMTKDVSSIIHIITAIYIQPLVNKDGEFKQEELAVVEQEILKMGILEVYPIANFFLRKSIASVKPGQKLSR